MQKLCVYIHTPGAYSEHLNEEGDLNEIVIGPTTKDVAMEE